jgi:hypothetical protein
MVVCVCVHGVCTVCLRCVAPLVWQAHLSHSDGAGDARHQQVARARPPGAARREHMETKEESRVGGHAKSQPPRVHQRLQRARVPARADGIVVCLNVVLALCAAAISCKIGIKTGVMCGATGEMCGETGDMCGPSGRDRVESSCTAKRERSDVEATRAHADVETRAVRDAMRERGCVA